MFIDQDQWYEELEYKELQLKFLEGIEDRLHRLEKIIVDIYFLSGSSTLECLQSLYSELHKLSGASGSFNFHEISSVSRSFESTVQEILSSNKDVVIDSDCILSFEVYLIKLKFLYSKTLV